MVSTAPVRLSDEAMGVCRLIAILELPGGSPKDLATSTGFLWRHEGRVWVVTNWHCLSGLRADTRKAIGEFTPNKVRVEGRFIMSKLPEHEGQVSIFFNRVVDIENECGNRIWLEHPRQNLVDVAAFHLPIAEDNRCRFRCLNEIEYESRWWPEVSDDAFIVGYPEGLSASHGTPIWKRASIASEPSLDYDNEPLLLVDTAGNEGMSGSPVIARGSGLFSPDSDFSDSTVFGSWKKFIGVYSGRLGVCGVRGQLGRVWKAEALDELFAQCSD